ncbi:MAG TPA: DNA polymerase III subunit delta [Bryobacteraceae bacterium]|nr:DNA polymerase III subunit delta [Bryobacteraceae bacterium]
MTPEQFLAKLKREAPAPVYLFLGPEVYRRQKCKDALLDKVLPGDERAEGFTQVDLDEASLAHVMDDACSMSLFARKRLIWVTSAETALPRRIAASSDDEGDASKSPDDLLRTYLKSPVPDTVLVFECSRYDFAGDDKAKLDRVAKFYSSIPDVVEFRPMTTEDIRALAQDLLAANTLKMEPRDLAFLIDAVGADASRLANEIDKLAVFAGPGAKITAVDLRALVPNASQSNIFAVVNALGRRDRAAALAAIDLLVRDGEYLPLALTFLGTHFRLTLAVKESRLQNAQQVVTQFSKEGIRMWRDRAEQLLHTASIFNAEQLIRGIKLIYEADKGLRDIRPDDKTVMESLVLNLTR